MDTQSFTPKAWVAQGRTLYKCDDPQWLHIDSVPAVRCAPVFVNYPFGIIALTQVYAFMGQSSAVSIQLALSEQDQSESKALHQQELERIFLVSPFLLSLSVCARADELKVLRHFELL